MRIKNYICIAVLSVILSLSGVYVVDATENSDANGVSVSVTPAEGDIVNGIEESSNGGISTMDVNAGPYFSKYTPNKKKHIQRFKLIASFTYVNNTKNTAKHSVTVSESSSKGSEWNGNIQFTADIKTKILAKAGASMGFGLKQSRSKNEAVGYTAEMKVSPRCKGTLKVYYGGWKTYGELKTYTFNTATPNKKVYKTTEINATSYKSKSLDIATVASEKAIN